jgi:ligand-binding sensor domain-containing protein
MLYAGIGHLTFLRTEFHNEGANGVRSISEDKNGDFWFNTEYRYSVYDSTTLKSDKFYTRKESIGGLDGQHDGALNEYLSTVRDNDNNLWFVTNPVLNELTNKRKRVVI